jgi:oxygen-independent coproporphyrinogen-3 oxidase
MKNTVDHTAQRLIVGEDERVLEFMMNALRLKEGFSISEFEDHSGQAFSAIAKQVDSLNDSGLLLRLNQQIRATEKGYHFLNNLLEEFL